MVPIETYGKYTSQRWYENKHIIFSHSFLLTRIVTGTIRSSRSEVFNKKGVLKNFTNFTGK